MCSKMYVIYIHIYSSCVLCVRWFAYVCYCFVVMLGVLCCLLHVVCYVPVVFRFVFFILFRLFRVSVCVVYRCYICSFDICSSLFH